MDVYVVCRNINCFLTLETGLYDYVSHVKVEPCS